MRTEDKGQRTKARTFDFRTLAKLVFVCCPLSSVLNALAAPEFAITPYLQHPAEDAMTIIYFTRSNSESRVTCRRVDGIGPTFTQETTGEWAQALTNNLACGDTGRSNSPLYRHRVRFEKLDVFRTYDYVVELDGGAAYTNSFRTAPDRNTPIRFVSYADCETKGDPWSHYVKNLARMKERVPDFIAISGDLTARGGIQSHWDGFWRANAGDKGTIAGSIPMLVAIGNHDLFDNGTTSRESNYYYDLQGETGTERFLSYFEFNSNGVDFTAADVPAKHRETKDVSQLFHREDYGPVTLIFLDTNNGDDEDHDKDSNYLKADDSSHKAPGIERAKGGRHPDFNPGSPQYDWLTNNLADAQAKSRFTFVFNHHCPYSRGAHNMDWREHEDGSALALRFLTETFVRYGVDGWYCGHDELLEHSITNGWEILPNGQRRKHTLSIYDLGCSGDTPRDSDKCTNPLEYWWNEDNYGGASGTKYGFLETDVTTNRNGQWTCTITPVQGSSGNYLNAQIVYVENPDRSEDENDLVYAEAANASHPIDGASQTKPEDWLPWTKPPEGPDPEPKRDWWIEEPVFTLATRITFATGEQTGGQYTGFLTKKGLQYAWGTNGVAETGWVTADGTPCGLEKPKGDAKWELMVRE